MKIEREEWECEVFDNLERMSAEHPGAEARAYNTPVEGAPTAGERELARGLEQMPVWADDDDAWCPRLA